MIGLCSFFFNEYFTKLNVVCFILIENKLCIVRNKVPKLYMKNNLCYTSILIIIVIFCKNIFRGIDFLCNSRRVDIV